MKSGGGEVSSIGGKEGNSLGAYGRIVACPLENSGCVCSLAVGRCGGREVPTGEGTAEGKVVTRSQNVTCLEAAPTPFTVLF